MQINCDRQKCFCVDACYSCNRMDMHIGGKKGRNWICKLNRTAREKRSFYTLMATAWLICEGVLQPHKMMQVEINYIGKKTRRKTR